MNVIEEIPRINITDMKNYLKPKVATHGNMDVNGININFRIVCASMMEMEYYYNNKPLIYYIRILKRKSNLNIGVIRLFECPITAKPCRMLYFHDGMFKSRYALNNAMYRCQTMSKNTRQICNRRMKDYLRFKVRRYGKPFYRGKITPYGKKYVKRLFGVG